MLAHKSDHRIIEVLGDFGLGRKAICQYACYYALDRGLFRDGAHQMTTGHRNTTKAFQSFLLKSIKRCTNIDAFYKEFKDK